MGCVPKVPFLLETFTCMYVCMLFVCILYACMYVCTYVCLYVCMYVCILHVYVRSYYYHSDCNTTITFSNHELLAKYTLYDVP